MKTFAFFGITMLAAHRGLRDAKAVGGAADLPLFGDGNEVLDLRKAHGPTIR